MRFGTRGQPKEGMAPSSLDKYVVLWFQSLDLWGDRDSTSGGLSHGRFTATPIEATEYYNAPGIVCRTLHSEWKMAIFVNFHVSKKRA